LVNKRVHFGVYASDDLFFGTADSKDPFIGNNRELLEDLQRYGRNNFRMEVIHAFPTLEEANRALARFSSEKTYRHGNSESMLGKQNSLGVVRSEETKRKMSDAKRKENNPRYGKEISKETRELLSINRANLRWINDGREEKQIAKTDPILDGWKLGRKPRRKAKDLLNKTEQ